MLSAAARCDIRCDVAPYRLSGTVYGTLLNHSSALAAFQGRLELPPYNAAPRAPVLYVKPRNTLAGCGETVEVPAATAALEVGACLGIVIGRMACNVPETRSLEYVAGFLLVNDVSIPHPDYYRPAVRYKARDGFCPIGPWVTARDAVANADALTIRTYVDGALVQTMSTAGLNAPGGAAAGRRDGIHDARAGRCARGGSRGSGTASARRPDRRHRGGCPRQARQSVRGGRGMMRARVAFAGAIHEAAPLERGRDEGRVRLADGRVLGEEEVVWLPPFDVGTVIALGLNYADHLKELAFKPQDEPLVFLKGPQTLARPSRLHPPAGRRAASCTTSASWP